MLNFYQMNFPRIRPQLSARRIFMAAAGFLLIRISDQKQPNRRQKACCDQRRILFPDDLVFLNILLTNGKK